MGDKLGSCQCHHNFPVLGCLVDTDLSMPTNLNFPFLHICVVLITTKSDNLSNQTPCSSYFEKKLLARDITIEVLYLQGWWFKWAKNNLTQRVGVGAWVPLFPHHVHHSRFCCEATLAVKNTPATIWCARTFSIFRSISHKIIIMRHK